MSYLALARKWRPKTFKQLVGQNHVSNALINSLQLQRVHHAFLFTGTRGVGKTSIARILAKSLNCENGISDNPCLACPTCIAIEQGAFSDFIEVDAASRTRVEDTRDMLDNVQYAPSNARFKIYLIDEVHMLSQHSFNALLKTLEEPPSHVKFILATTDPQKLPATVLSRCLQFHLKPLESDIIASQLEMILKSEQLDYELEAVNILASAAQGSLRDALSLLDQAITSCSEKLVATNIKLLLGHTVRNYAVLILEALAQNNAEALLEINEQILTEGGHYQYVMDELLTALHHITIIQSVNNKNIITGIADKIVKLSNLFSLEDIQLFYQIGIKGREEMHFAPSVAIGFSMTILRMLLFRPTTSEKLSPPIHINNYKLNTVEKNEHDNKNLIKSSSDPAILNTKTENVANLSQSWNGIVKSLKLTGLALNALENTEFISLKDKIVELSIAHGHQSLFTEPVKKRIEVALSEYYKLNIVLDLTNKKNIESTPAQQKSAEIHLEKQNALNALVNDPFCKMLQKEFDAELLTKSIISNKK